MIIWYLLFACIILYYFVLAILIKFESYKIASNNSIRVLIFAKIIYWLAYLI